MTSLPSSQNSREFLVYLWSELITLSAWNGFGLKQSSHCRLVSDRVETSFCIFAIFFNRDELAELLADNFFLNANIFTETKFLQNLINTSDWVFSKIINCISIETLDSVFVRKITKKACLHR
jgi:hypothetical protein